MKRGEVVHVSHMYKCQETRLQSFQNHCNSAASRASSADDLFDSFDAGK